MKWHLLLLALLANQAQAKGKLPKDNEKAFFQRQAVKTRFGEDIKTNYRNVTYKVHYNLLGKRKYIVQKAIQNVETLDQTEGANSSFQVEFFDRDSGKKISRLVKVLGDELSLDRSDSTRPFLKSTSQGCCGFGNTFRYYNVKTGKLVAEYEANAWHGTGAGEKFPIFAFKKHDKGTRYGTLFHFNYENGKVQELRVEFDGKPFQHTASTPEIKLVDGSLVVGLDCNDETITELKVPLKKGLFFGKKKKVQTTKIKKPKDCSGGDAY